MFCKNCGNEVDDNADFCPHCGAQLNAVQTAAVVPSSAPERPKNAVALAGFILALVPLLLSGIPIVNALSFPLMITALICSCIGVNNARKKNAKKKGLAIAGLVISLIAIGSVVLTLVGGLLLWLLGFGTYILSILAYFLPFLAAGSETASALLILL